MSKVTTSILFLVCLAEGAALIYWMHHLNTLRANAPPFQVEIAARNLSMEIAANSTLREVSFGCSDESRLTVAFFWNSNFEVVWKKKEQMFCAS